MVQYWRCQTTACCGRAKCVLLINEANRITSFINHIAHNIDRCEWNYPKVITAYYRENMFALVANGAKYPSPLLENTVESMVLHPLRDLVNRFN